MPANPAPEPDTRPVFEGDWSSASAAEKGRHGQRVKQWLKREEERREVRSGSGPSGEGAEAGALKGGTVEPSGEPERDADDLRALEAIIHGASALASDRIRAIEAKQRILNRNEAEALVSEHGPLVALRDALEALPSEERSDALRSLVRVEG